MSKHYLLEVWEGVEPDVHGPFISSEARDQVGLEELADMECPSGWFRLTVGDDGSVDVSSFSTQEVEDHASSRESDR